MFVEALKYTLIFLLGLLGTAIAIGGSIFAVIALSPFWLFLTIPLGIYIACVAGVLSVRNYVIF